MDYSISGTWAPDKVKPYDQENGTLISVKTSSSNSVPILLCVFNFCTKGVLKGNWKCWQAVLSLDSAHSCLC